MADARHPFSFRLLHGPYSAPECRVGEKLPCKIRGHRVLVAGLTKARLAWPYTLEPTGRPSPVLCGDLVRAVRRESLAAMSHHWGVSTNLVRRWRRSLGVVRTEGDDRVKRYCVERFLKAAHSAHSAAKSSTTRRRTNGTLDPSIVRFGPFTVREAVLLGTDTDAALGKALGRSPEAVKQARQRRGIPGFLAKRTDEHATVSAGVAKGSGTRRGHVCVNGLWTLARNVRLRHGPYAPPRCRVGSMLDCEYRGQESVVGGMTHGRIQWPYARIGGRLSPIVCGDLARAIRQEAAIAVAHHWGVSFGLVTRWRASLGVGLRDNEGTVCLKTRAVNLASQEAKRRADEATASRKPITAERAARALRRPSSS
jgi:hypothetical protein